MKKRRIVVIAGSKNDIIKHNRAGMDYLREKVKQGLIEVIGVHVRSIHRHPKKTRKLVKKYSDMHNIDVMIVEAGKAAHLPGCIDSYLRNELHDDRIVVIGVGLPGKNIMDLLAAELSITEVPSTQVIYAGKKFLDGCIIACEKPLPEIKLGVIPPIEDFTLDGAYAITVEEEPAVPQSKEATWGRESFLDQVTRTK